MPVFYVSILLENSDKLDFTLCSIFFFENKEVLNKKFKKAHLLLTLYILLGPTDILSKSNKIY
jgi:hypothetical protein